MTLEEAIKHAEEVADSHDGIKQIKAVTLEECRCAEEHRQLAEWLKELKAHREAWEKVLDEMMNVSIPGQDAEYVYQNIHDIIEKYRPKGGDEV